jgi:cytochrome b pre-mRNA-processing protein 3
MAFLSRLFRRTDDNVAARPLYDAAVALARQPGWYEQGGVPDSIDGRFDMLVAVLSAVAVRLEHIPESGQFQAWLTEIFVADMDGSLREIGIGDLVVGKHIGRMLEAFGGRLGAYRTAFADPAAMLAAVQRNIYRGDSDIPEAAARFVTARLLQLHAQLANSGFAALRAGQLPDLAL